jgi:hypothetical protein
MSFFDGSAWQWGNGLRQKNAVRFQALATETFHGQQSADARWGGVIGARFGGGLA